MTSRVVSPTVQRLRDDALANTSYLVEVGDGQAVSIDPPRDVDAHLALAGQLDLTIVATLDTHLHADYLSGAAELAAHGAEAIVPRGSGEFWAPRMVGDDERITWDGVALRALATPGHTPEHLAYVLEINGALQAVFTGGSLIVGGAGRTDLLGPARTQELAHAQFHSLRRLAQLPDTTALYPTHGAGSFCLAAATTVAEPTIGSERSTNPLLAIDDEDAFVEALVSGFGSFPTYYRHLQALNQTGTPLLGTLGEPSALTPEEVAARVEEGAWLVDARSAHDWAAEHPVGAVSNELRPAFASWLGWLVPLDSPVILIVDDHHRPEAARLARRIGYDDLAFLDGGIDAWRAAGLPTAAVDEVGPHEARDRQRADAVLLDVRQDAELAALRIPGALHVELGDLIGGAIPPASEVITFCGHGERSATAASLLEARGLRVANLTGGTTAWFDAGLPVER
jgi:glyoxylase-like metal-dependent hydrolase (beta-lactamase superfamily II)/rhodanese-related sulfurtransferase